MVTTNPTNKYRLSSYPWLFGNKYRRNSQKVHSLVYKDYSLVEHEDGTKIYVPPEEKAQLILKGKFKSSKLSIEDEIQKEIAKDLKDSDEEKQKESESDSSYEIPVAREKPKSYDDLDKASKTEIKRNSEFPFSGEEISPGDNGRINLPPYIVPWETSLTLPMTKQRQKSKKNKDVEKSLESLSFDEFDPKKRFSFKDTFWVKNKKKSNDNGESPEDAEMKKITENNEFKRFSKFKDNSDGEKNSGEDKEELAIIDDIQLAEPVEIFLEDIRAKENGGAKRFSHGFYLPKFPDQPLRPTERRLRNKKLDPNPLKKMFGIRGVRKAEGEEAAFHPPPDPNPQGKPQGEEAGRRYNDATSSQIRSDTESADHGSADKSSVSKLTSEKQPKKLVSGLFGSFRKGRKKERITDNDTGKCSLPFEIAVKEPPVDVGQIDDGKAEGIVYAELDMGRSPCSVMRRDDEKTEYAEIICPGTKPMAERLVEDLRISQENLTSSRENLTEVDEAFSKVAENKKEAAV